MISKIYRDSSKNYSMKLIHFILTAFTVALIFFTVKTAAQSGNVGVGTANPHPSSAVDVDVSGKGFLPPRLTTTQREAINSPAIGLIIYNTTTQCINIFNGNNWTELCGSAVAPEYPDGFVHCDINNPTTIVAVINPVTGRTWMDRNLGASQVATSSTDAAAYGDLYQWGRFADGHQCRNSATVYTLSNMDQPGHGYFILSTVLPWDWRSPQNNNLWQGVNGINNPCPSGYRVPTESEWNAEISSWVGLNAMGAFGSPLKIPLSGFRHFIDASFVGVGDYGIYWSSTINDFYGSYLHFDNNNAFVYIYYRQGGLSIRCIKD